VTEHPSRDEPEIAAALEHFAAVDVPARSIYPFSPVFPATVAGHRVVIKRARRSVPHAIAAWTHELAAGGFPCVTPIGLDRANPVRLASGSTWVAYPWIEGRRYRPTVDDIAAAGDLLGRLHSRGATAAGLPAFPWPEYSSEELAGDLASYESAARAHLPGADAAIDRLRDLGTRFVPELLPALRAAAVPIAATTSDWKASNLVYAPDGPVLIDPDNADRGPRILDLALAALLFHSETDYDRAFDAAEWTVFRDAYLARVTPTHAERALWPAALDYQLWEEVGWALGDDDWTDPLRPAFFADVLTVDAARFPL
jgi:Ser/Thr protein kinase RdoA (MazF antagonist)